MGRSIPGGGIPYLLSALALAMTSNSLRVFFVIYIAAIYGAQSGHFSYYKSFIHGPEIEYFLGNVPDVILTLCKDTETLFVSSATFIATIVALAVISRTTYIRRTTRPIPSTRSYSFGTAAISLAIVATPMHLAQRMSTGERFSAEMPDDARSILINSHYIIAYNYTYKIKPWMFHGKGKKIPAWTMPALPKKNQATTFDDIILVIGESASSTWFNPRRQDLDTTPLLHDMVSKGLAQNSTIAASGIATHVSIPMLMNIAREPDATAYLARGDNNLFKLAKERGYSTAFFSVQRSDNLGAIRSTLGLQYLDRYEDPSSIGFSNTENIADEFLLRNLDNIQKTQNSKNFIVLHMRGSHAPFGHQLPNTFEPQTPARPLSQYLRTIHYTDVIIASIVRHALTGGRRTLVVFTSDHGESATSSNRGHGLF